MCAELVVTQQRSPCSSPSGRSSQQPQTQSPALSVLSQARDFPATSLGEALIYLFNGESKQQLEKSGFSD